LGLQHEQPADANNVEFDDVVHDVQAVFEGDNVAPREAFEIAGRGATRVDDT